MLRVLVRAYLRRADRIVAIGETMRQRLELKGAAPERLNFIPNWVDTSEITPQQLRDNPWAQSHGLAEKFVVMHSGNVGHAQDLDSLVRADTQSKWSILEAIYDGPVDYVNYEYKPVILEKLPSLADGDAALVPVEMKDGMDMVDADGNLMTLQKGVKYFPSGCSSSDCIVEYDGKTPVKMDQLAVKFKIKSGITWSDGTPVTAQDSVTSYTLAASPVIPTNKGIIQRTASYKALDELTVEWTGLPGYRDQQYATQILAAIAGAYSVRKRPCNIGIGSGDFRKTAGLGSICNIRLGAR